MKRRIKIILVGLGALAIIGVLPALLAWLIWIDIKASRDARSPETWKAWSKGNPAVHLSYEEWLRLYRANALPGQPPKPEQVVIYQPMPIYTR